MKTKLLIIGPSQNGRVIGGIDSILEFYFQNKNLFGEKGYEISYINSNQIERKNYNYGYLNFSNLLNSIFFYKKVINCFFKNNPDIIHFHSSTSISLLRDQLLILLIDVLKKIKKSKTKIFIQIHSNIEIAFGKNLVYYLNLTLFRSNIHNPILLCEKSFNFFKNYQKPKLLLKNISFLELNISKKTENNHLEMIFIGSVSKAKGIMDLLKALVFIDSSKYKLNIIGEFNDHKFEQEIYKFINNYDYINVRFLGKKIGNEKFNLLSQSDLFILPSYTEGMPISILEAMKFGNAIISTNVGCIRNLIKDHAVVINPGEINNLRNEIAKFIYNPVYLTQYKEKSNHYSKNNDKKQIYFENIIKIYSQKTLV